MSLSIIMYHYVRELEGSQYPGIKGRTVEDFKGQLDYIQDNYTLLTAEEIIHGIKNKDDMPDNAAWLTFDDGYVDHYKDVFPILKSRGIQGSFFPPSNAILHGELLDVNKVHFILAAQSDTNSIISEIKNYISQNNEDINIQTFNEYWKNLAKPSRYDPAEVMFIKNILQHGLPEETRNSLATDLFHKFVADDIKAFAKELYLSPDQIREMIEAGMYFGSHGARHYWMDRLTPEQQRKDIDDSLSFLRNVGASLDNWIMCYPYGAHNSSLHTLLAEYGCGAAITTKAAIANIDVDSPYALPRLDTNDLPLSR